VVADKKLGNSVTIHETIRVKSAAWDDNGGWCCCCVRLMLAERAGTGWH
jgi:hypothetical protein